MSKVHYNFGKNKYNHFVDIYMGIRAAILDRCANDFLNRYPEGAVLHLGCGLDSRVLRVKKASCWIDIDLPDVIDIRRRFYRHRPGYKMISADVTKPHWIEKIDISPQTPVLVIAEGLTMYFTYKENKALFNMFYEKFRYTEYVFDAYYLSAVA